MNPIGPKLTQQIDQRLKSVGQAKSSGQATFQDKFEQFNSDLSQVIDMKGKAGDMAPLRSGNVEIPGVASLVQTAKGCSLMLAHAASNSGPAGFASYNYDRETASLKVHEYTQPSRQVDPGSYNPYSMPMPMGFPGGPRFVDVPGSSQEHHLDLAKETIASGPQTKIHPEPMPPQPGWGMTPPPMGYPPPSFWQGF